jgi:hypothetical protein
MNRVPTDAYQHYVSLGPQRTYEALARHYGVSKRAITKRASREQWQERLSKVEAQARDRFDEKLAETLEAVNGRHLKTLRLVQAKAIEALRSMPLQSAMSAIRALDMAIKQERVILGEPNERTAVSVEDTIKREYARWMGTGDEGAGWEPPPPVELPDDDEP